MRSTLDNAQIEAYLSGTSAEYEQFSLQGILPDFSVVPQTDGVNTFSSPIRCLSQQFDPSYFEHTNEEALMSFMHGGGTASARSPTAKSVNEQSFLSREISTASFDTVDDAMLEYCSSGAAVSPQMSTVPGSTSVHTLIAPEQEAIREIRKQLIPQPALGPPRKPPSPRQACSMCKKTFSRSSDLIRHQQDVHERSTFIFKCNECRHGKFGRRDKMLEHCRNHKHDGGFSKVEVVSNADVASALHTSCRRKKATRFLRNM